MFGSFFDTVLQVVKEWNPKGQFSSEDAYRDDLLKHLRECLKPSESVGSYILGLGSSEQHVIQKEAGRHLADIGIDRKIGIELKLNLKHKKEKNRLVGQVVDFLDSYSYLIIVLCGNVEPEIIDALKYDLGKLIKPTFLGEQEKVIRIVSKCKETGQKGEAFGLF